MYKFLSSAALVSGVAAVILASGVQAAVSQTVWDVSNKKQLFIDDRFIASSTNVQLIVNRPQLAGPALEPGPAGSWDDAVVTWGQVMADEGIFKMWAGGFSAKAMKGDWRELEVQLQLGYATSPDGIHWTKPKLGIFEWEGSKANNITARDPGYVMIDPNAKKEERYKLLCTGAAEIGATNIYDALHPDKGGLYFYTSPDGIHWKWNPKRVFPFFPDTLNQIDFDPRIGKYVVYVRSWPNGFLFDKTYGRAIGRIELDDPMAPWPYDANVARVEPWGPKYIATVGKEIPTVITFPGYTNEGVWTDLYNPCVSMYQWAEEVYLAFPSINHYLHDSATANDSTLNIGMVVSRDGINWKWPSTEPYIPYGAPGSGRGGQLYSLVGLLRVGDKLYQYHAATDLRHNANAATDYTLEQLRNVGKVYRTVQRLDGFVAADFTSTGGELTTPPLNFSGRRLFLNLNAKGGTGRVEILDSAGIPLPGFDLASCQELKSDSVNHVVSWKKGGDLSALQRKNIRLRFVMRDAKLYAFQFTDGR